MATTKEELEIRKLEAEVVELEARTEEHRARKDLEIQKLEAEVAELKVQRTAHHPVATQFQIWLGLLVAAGTVVGGGWTLYEQVDTFLDQERRQYEFQVPDQIIALSDRLGSENPIDRANAAMLLSAFEEHAIPILVNSLRRVDVPDLNRQLVVSLKLVMRKPRIEPKDVLDPLREAAEQVFEEEYRKTDASTEAVTNYVDALGELGAAQKDDAIIKTLQSFKTRLWNAESKIVDLKRNKLTSEIDEAIRLVAGTNRVAGG